MQKSTPKQKTPVHSPAPNPSSSPCPSSPQHKKPTQQAGARKPDVDYSNDVLLDFLRWQAVSQAEIKKQFKQYEAFRMRELNLLQNQLDEWAFSFHNGKKGEEYSCSFTLPEFIDRYKLSVTSEPAEIGLHCKEDETDPRKGTLCGTPTLAGEHTICLTCTHRDGLPDHPDLKRDFTLIINPDPRDLWQNHPTDEGIDYYRPDSEAAFLPAGAGGATKQLLAASQRGRSHAHEGKPRDDHFVIRRNAETGWSILAVADGAGSAQFSREGSRLAAETAAGYCDEHIGELEKADSFLPFGKEPENEECRKKISQSAYKVLGNAAFKAHQAIREEAERKERNSKEYASTLLFTACKRFDFGWFIASFAVGDGAMAVICERNEGFSAELLAEPDEGEYSGQTRFITMDDIFKDYKSMQKRIGVRVVPDFTALLLMTDGVSDAKFETDANLRAPEKWQDLWQELQQLPLARSAEEGETAQKNLLEWLNFWSPGNHDDRTLALIY